MAGTFISFEGIDGCGKSTQAELVAAALAEKGVRVIRLREPGGTAISEKIRTLLLDPDNMEMRPQAELLLYEASRAQLVSQVIRPALDADAVVLCDRFFDSTFAYQAGARGIDEETVRKANELGSCGCIPDVTLVFDLDPSVAWGRATRKGADRLEVEGLAFQERVRAGYHRAAELEPERISLVDADGMIEEVFERACAALADTLPELENLDVKGFMERQADVERAMADIAQGLGENE